MAWQLSRKNPFEVSDAPAQAQENATTVPNGVIAVLTGFDAKGPTRVELKTEFVSSRTFRSTEKIRG